MSVTDQQYQWVSTQRDGLNKQLCTDLWNYRFLIWGMAWKTYVSRHRQTYLGIMWHLLRPLLMVFVYQLLFIQILNVSMGSTPPFLLFLAGNTLWQLFSDTVNAVSGTISANAATWNKVYYPRLVSPLSEALYVCLLFSGQFIILVCLAMYYNVTGFQAISITSWIWAFAAIAIILGMAFGAGLLISTLSARYRDFAILTQIALRILFFVSPVLYAYSKIPMTWKWLGTVNPLTGPFELFRYALAGGPFPDLYMLVVSMGTAVMLVATGLTVFLRKADQLLEVA